ncbi:MAG TPA: hypothetical protein VF815_07655 [Myxococcaceae bacterium]|jgi:hypothetical protein
MNAGKHDRDTADEVPEDGRTTEDMEDEDEATGEMTPAQRKAFRAVVPP